MSATKTISLRVPVDLLRSVDELAFATSGPGRVTPRTEALLALLSVALAPEPRERARLVLLAANEEPTP